MNLSASHFREFFKAVNGFSPFPWQRRLLHEIAENRQGYWPPVLALPTSAGKTSVIDIAVFLLALEVQGGKPKPVMERKASLRTFFVVDRRIIVDEAGMKARKLARLLNESSNGAPPVVREVAARLGAFGGLRPLHVSVLRGGMYRDESWAQAPNQPTICLSTVDQVGSRLLFRGYGVSKKQYPLHAGLVGNDSLIIVDEAHLSRPFLETLKAVEFYRGERWAERHVPTPLQTVFMSATVEDSAKPVVEGEADRVHAERGRKVGLGSDEYGDDYEDPVLRPRLEARKLARLEEEKGGDEDEKNRQKFAARLTAFAKELATIENAPEVPKKGRAKKRAGQSDEAAPPARVIGVVVNRVDTARRVFDLLFASRKADLPDYDVILLTGRIRPYDRDELLFRTAVDGQQGWFRFMEARANREQNDYDRLAPPKGNLFVVATQTVEVGANISFDALVTEAAPLDALRQRFGRLDRLGFRKVSHAVIVVRKDLIREDDPVYGTKIKSSWDWLKARERESGKAKRIDFGVLALNARLPEDPQETGDLCAETVSAAIMLPAHLDSWVQTTMPPSPDPDPGVFLHGPKPGPPDVNVVWRADLTEELLANDFQKNSPVSINVLAFVPPSSMEALPLPVWTVRRWLKGEFDSEIADVESAQDPTGNLPLGERGRPCLRWRGPDDEDTRVIQADDIRPGDTVVVPSKYGGIDPCGCWKPEATDPVPDVGDDCSWRAKRKPVLRIHRESCVFKRALMTWHVPNAEALADAIQRKLNEAADANDLNWEEVFQLIGTWPSLPESLAWLRAKSLYDRPPEYPDRAGMGGVLIGRKRIAHPDEPGVTDTVYEDSPGGDDSESFNEPDEEVTLDAHCHGVATILEGFGKALGIPGDLHGVLRQAALLHDAGKADPRFQEWLHGSEVGAAKTDKLIAKSTQVKGQNRAARNAARRRAGWPRAARHEALSVRLAESCREVMSDLPDPEVLIYLIGAHHGNGRPLWPVAEKDDLPAGLDPQTDCPASVSCTLHGRTLTAPGSFRPELALARFDSGWTERFWRLVRTYGYWGLAYLETLLILADHRRSESERGG